VGRINVVGRLSSLTNVPVSPPPPQGTVAPVHDESATPRWHKWFVKGVPCRARSFHDLMKPRRFDYWPSRQSTGGQFSCSSPFLPPSWGLKVSGREGPACGERTALTSYHLDFFAGRTCLGLFQYGLLHFGQRLGSRVMFGTHLCPQRRHSHPETMNRVRGTCSHRIA